MIIVLITLAALLNDYLHRRYLKNLKKLIDYNKKVMKELEELTKGSKE